MSVYDNYEVVIGLEVHSQLMTDSKIFSPASTAYGAAPNTQVAESDLGLPGTLPVLNRRAVEFALRAGLALDCTINMRSVFARKNYFYPDLPTGYQLSQADLPICENGHLTIDDDGQEFTVRINRIHMEQDAGKSSHIEKRPFSLVDLNRAGVPLIEIVTEPDMRSPDQAVAYLKELHAIVVYLGICDGNMEEGSFRCDANISVRPHGQKELGTRTELKNINSFKFVKDALIFEIRRQIDLIEAGQKIVQETRLYNANKGITFSMRSKEDATDYRYFPDPDLPALIIDPELLASVRQKMPELPAQKRARFIANYDLSVQDASVLCSDRATAAYFEEAHAIYPENPKILANWVINELLREVRGDQTLENIAIRPAHLARLVALIDDQTLSGKLAKTVFEDMLETGEDPDKIVDKRGLKQVSDTGELTRIIDEIMDQNPGQVDAYREGKTTLIGWFVGQTMKRSGGKANPQIVNDLLREKLDN